MNSYFFHVKNKSQSIRFIIELGAASQTTLGIGKGLEACRGTMYPGI